MKTMHRTGDHKISSKKGGRSRKIAQQDLIRASARPVSTIIQSLAAMSNLRMEDIVEQLVKEQRALGATSAKATKSSKKKPAKANQGSARKGHQVRSPKRKVGSPANRTVASREATKNVGDTGGGGAVKDNIIAGKWKLEKLNNDLVKKGVAVLSRVNDAPVNKPKPETKQSSLNPEEVGEKTNKPKVQNSHGNVQKQVSSPMKLAGTRSAPVGKIEVKTSLTVGQNPSSMNSNDGKGDVTSASKTATNPKSVLDLKLQLIERFNQKRMEEKAKAQLSPERLSQVSGADSNDKKPQQTPATQPGLISGSLMNFGVGMKQSEMIEKEFQTVAHLVTKKRYLQLKLKAEEALRKQMTFAVCGRVNGWQTVRRFFNSKNWVERFDTGDDKKISLPNLSPPPDADANVLSRLTSRLPVKFIWSEVNLNWTIIGASTIVNKYPASIRPLSTKVGLLLHLNNQVWTYNANYSYVKFPRSTSLYDEEDMKHFSALFRINACVCLLKHITECFEQEKEFIAANGTVPLEAADFAVQRVCEQVAFMENADVDIWHNSLVSDDEWTLYLLRFQDIVHFGAKFKIDQNYNVSKLVTTAKLCLKHVREFWPDIDVEGVRNLWIIKPSASSCGRGIRIFKTLVDIQQHCRTGFSFLAQKYIERPMFIHKTKFDIRQWFVVSSINPLVIYLYDICYLRFCSREFSLVNLHESVHLSNNSVQCRYSNMSNRSSELPSDNMWDSDTFIDYLRARKEDDKWYAISLPGIRKGIIGAYLASQDMLTHRTNSFNLYGADFMLTEDFVPWLIEINSGPCLRGTTSVTSRLCPMVIEDTINLVLKTMHPASQDQLSVRPGLPTECSRFKLIYSQTVLPPPATGRSDLAVTAKKARIHISHNYNDRKKTTTAVPMFKDEEEDMKSTTYESRSLKYQKIADYKLHSGATIRTTTLEDTKRPPIPPGGVIPADLAAYRTNYDKSEPNNNVKTNLTKPTTIITKSEEDKLVEPHGPTDQRTMIAQK